MSEYCKDKAWEDFVAAVPRVADAVVEAAELIARRVCAR